MRGRKEAKVIIATLGMTAMLPLTVYASSNYAENAGRWVLEQAFWVILVMGIVTASLATVSYTHLDVYKRQVYRVCSYIQEI